MPKKTAVRIGSHAAMWGDWPGATPQLLKGGKIDYLVGDYLAEVTMAILAKAKKKNDKMGYATDFVNSVMNGNMKELKKQGVKVVVNAGGIAVIACRDALLAEAKKQGVSLKVGVVLGDDLMDRTNEFRSRGVQEMFSADAYPTAKATMSCNAYLGAFPIAEALAQGCDVVLTGRVVDSALVLGPLIYEYGWGHKDFDKLAAGTLAGHLIECGAQSTGGLFTDYERVESWVNIGYPIVEVRDSGVFTLSKPPNTDGLVCFGSVCEQMLYEIQDPGAYHVPDVACDFTQVKMKEIDTNVVEITNVKGRPPTAFYKTCTTHSNGWKWSAGSVIVGHDAARKARRTGETLITRFKTLLKKVGAPDFLETRIETIGAGEFFKEDADRAREVLLRVSLRHVDKRVFFLLRRQVACIGVSMNQGHAQGAGAGMTQVVSSYMHLEPKAGIIAKVDVDGKVTEVPVPTDGGFTASASDDCTPVAAAAPQGPTVPMRLLELCYARSGDKGDKVNIGLIARRSEYLPLLRHAVTAEKVKEYFSHNCKGEALRFDLPGTNSMNFLLDKCLGGGGTSSLHSDPLGKTYGQVLLGMKIEVPVAFAPRLHARL